MLRLAVPIDERDRDVRVALVVDTLASAPASADKWAAVREKLEAAGIRVPPPGADYADEVEPEVLPGPSASEILIRDRR
jgi:hypothetical protein